MLFRSVLSSLLDLTERSLCLTLDISAPTEDEDLGPAQAVCSFIGHQQSTYQIQKHIQVRAGQSQAIIQQGLLV